MKILLMIFAAITLFGSLSMGETCSQNSKTVRRFVRTYVRDQIKKNGEVPRFNFVKGAEFAFSRSDLLKDDSKAQAAFDSFGGDFQSDKKDFRTYFEAIVRPGAKGKLLIPIVGATYTVHRKSLLYICAYWDESDIDNAKVQIYFLKTNAYREGQFKFSEKIKVTHDSSRIEFFPLSSISGILTGVADKIIGHNLFAPIAEDIIGTIEKTTMNTFGFFLRVGASRLTFTKDNLKIRTSLGVLTRQLKIVDADQKLKPQWWRLALKGEDIFVLEELTNQGQRN